MNLLPFSIWMKTPLGTRIKIAQEFGITKHRATHVADNQVIDDGYNMVEIEKALSVEKLQNFLHSSELEITILFQNLVDVMEGKVAILVNQVIEPEVLVVESPLNEEEFSKSMKGEIVAKKVKKFVASVGTISVRKTVKKVTKKKK